MAAIHGCAFALDETDRIIFAGDIIENFRGEWFIFRRCYTKAAPSTGRVVVSPCDAPEVEHEYYPGVFKGRVLVAPEISVRDGGTPFAYYKVRRRQHPSAAD